MLLSRRRNARAHRDCNSPENGDSAVPLNQRIIATFSELMDSATISDLTFKVNSGATVITGTVSYSGNTAIFSPDALLDTSTSYSATITTGAQDIQGNSLEVHSFGRLSGPSGPTNGPR